MKFLLLLLLFPLAGLSQVKLEKVSFLDNKVEILAPKKLSAMSDEQWTLKYHDKKRPVFVLSDADGEINLLGDLTPQPATDNQMSEFKDFQMQQLKRSRTDAQFLENGVKTVNGKKVGFFKFLSQAIDQKVFNYYFFTTLNGKILFFTFNCLESQRKSWEKTADEMVESLKVN